MEFLQYLLLWKRYFNEVIFCLNLFHFLVCIDFVVIKGF